MKNKTKKISCMLVVVCILATMFVGLSVSVQAATSVSVSTFTQLEAAVNNPNMDIIIINNDIVLEGELYIDHDIKLIANRSREILSYRNGRHFWITKSVNISFNNVILKGGSDYGGGIMIDNLGISGGIIDVTIENPNIQNCYGDGGAITCFTETNLTVLGGVLKNNSSTYCGGALRKYGGTIDLYGVVIEGNSADAGGGGGIYADGGTLNMYSCILENNTSSYNAGGGGVYIEADTFVNIYDSEFSNNTSLEGSGGGVYIEVNAFVNIYDSEFSNNTSTYTGGAINNQDYLFVQNTTFEGNTSNDDGGCIYNDTRYNAYGERLNVPYTSVDNCTFTDNTSQNGKGGAISIPEDSTGAIYECIFSGNTSKLDGGAIYYNGYSDPNLGFLVSNTTFSDNFSEAGGYYMYLPVDITEYNRIIRETTASSPFYYAFNNYDISYTNGIPVPV